MLLPDDEIDLQDEHVEELNIADSPDLVVIQVTYNRFHDLGGILRSLPQEGAYVHLGGLPGHYRMKQSRTLTVFSLGRVRCVPTI
jgi:hypothetical protein